MSSNSNILEFCREFRCGVSFDYNHITGASRIVLKKANPETGESRGANLNISPKTPPMSTQELRKWLEKSINDIDIELDSSKSEGVSGG